MAVLEFYGTRSDAPDRGHLIGRVCRREDIPWLLSMARRAYPGPDWRDEDAAAWLGRALASPAILALRGAHSALVATTVTWFWRRFEPEAHVVFALAEPGHHWELARLMRDAVPWCRAQGVTSIRMGADTGVDLGPLAQWVARNVGVVEREAASYRITF